MKKPNKKGYTIFEVIVAMLLTSILMVIVTNLLLVSINVFAKIKIIQNSQTVSNVILDKVCGEIMGAQVGTIDNFTMTISPDNNCISFYTRSGSPVYIKCAGKGDINLDFGATANKLLIRCKPIRGVNMSFEGVNWTFDDKMYMGYDITELKFDLTYKEEQLTNIIKVSMTINNAQNDYTYQSVRYVECYNFLTSIDINKIMIGTIVPE